MTEEGKQEIVEFPWVVVDCKAKQVIAEEQLFVRPVETEVSEHCTTYTGITPFTVEDGLSLEGALREFSAYLDRTCTDQNKSFCLVADGESSVKRWLCGDARRKRVALPDYCSSFVDLRAAFKEHYPQWSGATDATLMADRCKVPLRAARERAGGARRGGARRVTRGARCVGQVGVEEDCNGGLLLCRALGAVAARMLADGATLHQASPAPPRPRGPASRRAAARAREPPRLPGGAGHAHRRGLRPRGGPGVQARRAQARRARPGAAQGPCRLPLRSAPGDALPGDGGRRANVVGRLRRRGRAPGPRPRPPCPLCPLRLWWKRRTICKSAILAVHISVTLRSGLRRPRPPSSPPWRRHARPRRVGPRRLPEPRADSAAAARAPTAGVERAGAADGRGLRVHGLRGPRAPRIAARPRPNAQEVRAPCCAAARGPRAAAERGGAVGARYVEVLPSTQEELAAVMARGAVMAPAEEHPSCSGVVKMRGLPFSVTEQVHPPCRVPSSCPSA